MRREQNENESDYNRRRIGIHFAGGIGAIQSYQRRSEWAQNRPENGTALADRKRKADSAASTACQDRRANTMGAEYEYHRRLHEKHTVGENLSGKELRPGKRE